MEFNEKLQQLRKQHGFTQDELSKRLYVSRTAVSKWESGRGYPNIDSLKDIAKLFSVTVDELLSGEELLRVASAENKQKTRRFRGWVFALLDISVILCLFLPLFGQTVDGVIQAVSLLGLTKVQGFVKAVYFVFVVLTTVFGIITLVLQNYEGEFWERSKIGVSVALNALGVLLFIVSPQPYVAVCLFLCLALKILLCVRR